MVALAGCYGTGATVMTTPQPTQEVEPKSPSVDPAITPVSASRPDTDSARALDACSITDTEGRFGSNGPLGIEIVSGMGKVIPARDAVKYVALNGAPEIATDAPAWIITTNGWISLPLVDPMLKDPTCVFVNNRDYWYVTGDARSSDGKIQTPMPLPAPPYRLPALIP